MRPSPSEQIMKKTIHKTLLAALACLMMLASVLSMTACGKAQPMPAQVPVPTEAVPVQEAAEPVVLPEPAQIRISEYMAKNRAVLQDEYALFSDWIELENCSPDTIRLCGWHISDSDADSGWAIPDISLAPGERVLVFASGKDTYQQELHADFSLSQGESICLRDEYGRIVDRLDELQAETDLSYVRSDDGFEPCSFASPGYSNDPEGYEQWQQSRACSSPLVIYELMSANTAYDLYNNYEYYDWVEIKNVSSENIELSDYYLSDDDDNMFMWRFPRKTLYPGQIFTVICDGTGFAGDKYTAHSNFELSAKGDQLYLSNGEQLLDYVSLSYCPLNCSYGRIDGQNGFYFFERPSPRSQNYYPGCRLVGDKPVSLTKDGVYDGVESVTVELSASGDIYYSTDGSRPDIYSSKYTGPFELHETTVVRAVSVNEGMLDSDALTLNFIINEGHSLPVISVVTDSVRAFNDMYKAESKYIELPGAVSLYEEDGSFTINCGVKLSGATSLVLPKKNISVKFRPRYGADVLNYDVFDGGVSSFTSLTMRAGQDQTNAIIRDELCQQLCVDSCDAVLTQRYKYCVMYINGRYWGIYALKDKLNEQFYASIADVSKESVTMVDANVKRDCSFYQDVWEFCVYNDMSLPENYETLCQHLDVESLIDWIIIEGFCANNDLRSGNVRYCNSTENDGRWRVVYYDLDCAFRHGSMNYYNLMSDSAIYNQQVSQIINALFENEDFRSRFLEKFSAAIKGPLSNKNVLSRIDMLAEQIAPEVERNAQRWGWTAASWERSIDSLRGMITDYNWQQYSIDNICRILELSDEEKLEYFG